MFQLTRTNRSWEEVNESSGTATSFCGKIQMDFALTGCGNRGKAKAMRKQWVECVSRESAGWGASHPNGRLAVIGAALWFGPLVPFLVMAAVPVLMPESTPELILTPIMVVIYFASILWAFVLPVCNIAAWIILPFAGWRAWRDYRRRMTVRIRPRDPMPGSPSASK